MVIRDKNTQVHWLNNTFYVGMKFLTVSGPYKDMSGRVIEIRTGEDSESMSSRPVLHCDLSTTCMVMVDGTQVTIDFIAEDIILKPNEIVPQLP